MSYHRVSHSGKHGLNVNYRVDLVPHYIKTKHHLDSSAKGDTYSLVHKVIIIKCGNCCKYPVQYHSMKNNFIYIFAGLCS